MSVRSLSQWLATGLVLATMSVPAFAGGRCCAPKSVQWVQGYEKGLAQAKGQSKIAVMDFYSESCPWCDEMDRKTFADPSIVKLSKQFVMVKVNAMRDRRQSIRHNVRGYPTIVILDAKGKELERIVGYREASDLASDLKHTLARTAAVKQTASR